MAKNKTFDQLLNERLQTIAQQRVELKNKILSLDWTPEQKLFLSELLGDPERKMLVARFNQLIDRSVYIPSWYEKINRRFYQARIPIRICKTPGQCTKKSFKQTIYVKEGI